LTDLRRLAIQFLQDLILSRGSTKPTCRLRERPGSRVYAGSWQSKGHIESQESPEEAALREAYEEAGIRGVVIGAIGGPLEFDSKSEREIVQYFLIYARSDCTSSEGHDPTWFPVSEAVKHLTHEDSRILLTSVESEITLWTNKRVNGSDRDGFTQLMLAQFAHIGDSLLRSEESGETRVAFFLTFAGGVGTAVGFLAGNGGPLQNQGRLHETINYGGVVRDRLSRSALESTERAHERPYIPTHRSASTSDHPGSGTYTYDFRQIPISWPRAEESQR